MAISASVRPSDLSSKFREKWAMPVFMAANFAAGFLHYLFQVLAAKRLNESEFAALSSWIAYLSFGFVVAGFIQYSANFLPLSKSRLRVGAIVALITAVFVCVVVVGYADASNIQLSVVTVGLAIITAWLSGQAQSRMMFFSLGAANVILALTKISLPLTTIAGVASDRLFFFAVGLAYLPAIVLLSIRFLFESEPKQTQKFPVPKALVATLLLAFAATVFPQYEIMLMEKTQSAFVFQAFARVSLFYKGVFFAFLIFAQWLLPHQLHHGRRLVELYDWRLLLVAIAASSAAAGVANLFIESPLWVFMSCLSTCLLTWLFLLIQEHCAKQNLSRALLLLSGVGLSAGMQLIFRFPIEIYYSMTMGANMVVIVHSLRRHRL